MESLVKFLPRRFITEHEENMGSQGPGASCLADELNRSYTPESYQFILTAADWHLLQRISVDQGSESGPTGLLDYLEVVTCDAAGNETTEPADKAAHYRCRIWHCDLTVAITANHLSPSDFNAYLGETQLIPIVHDLLEAYREHQSQVEAAG